MLTKQEHLLQASLQLEVVFHISRLGRGAVLYSQGIAQPHRVQYDLSLGKLVHSSHQELILASDW